MNNLQLVLTKILQNLHVPIITASEALNINLPPIAVPTLNLPTSQKGKDADGTNLPLPPSPQESISLLSPDIQPYRKQIRITQALENRDDWEDDQMEIGQPEDSTTTTNETTGIGERGQTQVDPKPRTKAKP